MDNRFNTLAGWALFAGIIALGGGWISTRLFHSEVPETQGYKIEGVEGDTGEGAAAGPSFNTLLATADPGKGEKVFAKCAACHSVNEGGANGIGPNLYEVVGDAVATGRGGFAFSDALKAKGGKWDFAELDAWLTSPRNYAPGTKMTFAGLGNPQDRANLIAWLNTQGSNLPLPAADAPAAAPEDAANAANAAAPADNAAAPAK